MMTLVYIISSGKNLHMQKEFLNENRKKTCIITLKWNSKLLESRKIKFHSRMKLNEN